MPTDARDIARLLAARASDLARELLPAGKRAGSEWRVGSLAGEPGESLGVRLHGARAGVWCDFASGEVGDALDLVAQVRYRGEKKPAIAWARQWLGLGDDAPTPAPRPTQVRSVEDESDGRRRASLAIWLDASSLQLDDPASSYLCARSIDLRELGRAPRALRFHPELFNTESRRLWPALVAAICNDVGDHIATHRTWLTRENGHWIKAPLKKAKMTLGSYAGGTIRLWRGASGRPLAQASANETIVIGEGIETCLSIAIACPELRIVSAVSVGNMARVVLPPAIAEVILAADNDGENAATASALQRAVDRFVGEGRRVRIAMPERAGADWNDVLQDAA